MNKNIFKEKLQQRAALNGTHISMPVPENGEILGLAGFDFVWVDTEHAPIDGRNLLNCINLLKMSGTATLVRVPVDDYNQTKKVLEMWPDGIVFPMINNRKLAERAVGFTLYPPYGTRGFGPMRAVRYGCDDVGEYIEHGVYDLARIVQIETEEAVVNLEDIASVPNIDGFIIGPCDLSASVGELYKKDQPKTRRLIETIGKTLTRLNKSFGVSIGDASEETIRFYLDIGANIISSGVDYAYLLRGAENMRSRIDNVRSQFNLTV